jgi:hypothetical protein
MTASGATVRLALLPGRIRVPCGSGLRNTSGRPGTETSNPVLGLVVTALPKTIPEHTSNFTLTPSKSLKSSWFVVDTKGTRNISLPEGT